MKTHHANSAPLYSSDIYFDYIFRKGSEMRTNTEAVIFFVYSGEMNISSRHETISVGKGQYAFVKHDVEITISKKDCGTDRFCCAFLGFSKNYLFDLYLGMNKHMIPFPNKRFEQAIIKLPYTPSMQGLYVSFKPYLEYGIRPTKEILELKRREGIYSLVLTDERFYPCLFDFIQYI